MVSESSAKSPNRLWATIETIFLIGFCAILTLVNVPAQWTGVATDPGFTAWVAPISNRLHTGPKLYEEGTHMPLPPLSHVVLYLASFGKATWLTESLAHHLATMLGTLLLYFYFKKLFPPHVSFLAALASLTIYNSCETILFYNSLGNLLVACLAVCASEYYRKQAIAKNSISWGWLIALGIIGPALLLSKQSIGGLAIMGCALVIVCSPSGGILARVRNLILYGICTGIGLALLCLLISPWVNLKGLLQDVFLTGSQCKGGTGEVLGKIGGCVEYLIGILGISFTAIIGFVALGLNPRWTRMQSSPSNAAISTTAARRIAWCAILMFTLLVIVMGHHKNFGVGYKLFLTVGLGICVFAVATILVPVLPSVPAWPFFKENPWPALGCMAVVLITGAIGHTLSGRMLAREFNWNGQTVPLIQLAMAVIFWAMISGIKSLGVEWPQGLRSSGIVAVSALVVGLSWWNWRWHGAMLKDCTDRWNDCAWYQGARVTTEARDLHEAVTRIHQLAGRDGKTLILPEDPNLQECFGTERAQLSCAIIYADQYWTKYIDKDRQTLTDNPPKVLVIGPEKSWRAYGEERNENNAAEKLIDQVQTNLIPKLYHLEFRQTINYGGGKDTLAVYVRNN